jgi:biotin transport system substrate-specific component
VPGIYVFGSTVPLTLQTLGVTLAGSVLGPRKGALAVLTYLAMIAVGLPVASGYKGGLGVIAGPTGGYLVGFVLAAFVVGLLARLALRRGTGVGASTGLLLACLAGIPVVYAVGVPWLAVSAGMPFGKALQVGALIFLVGDVVKAAVATVVTSAVARALPQLSQPTQQIR